MGVSVASSVRHEGGRPISVYFLGRLEDGATHRNVDIFIIVDKAG